MTMTKNGAKNLLVVELMAKGEKRGAERTERVIRLPRKKTKE